VNLLSNTGQTVAAKEIAPDQIFNQVTQPQQQVRKTTKFLF
jgi:hypothetical protein